MSGIQDYLGLDFTRLCSSCAFAAAATIFYKKNFREDNLPCVGALSLLGLFLETSELYPISCVGAIASFGLVWYTVQKDKEWFKSAMKMDFFVILLFAILDVRVGLLPMPYWKNIRIFAAATPQFLRRPLWLKTKLQDVRSKLGPMYVLYVSSYVLTRATDGPEWLQRVAQIAMVSCIFAGVVFRPDNSTMLDLTKYKTKLSERKSYHRSLMIGSFGACAILTAADVFFRHQFSI